LSILEQTDLLRIKANSELNPNTKSALGQFFTSAPICLYMVSLFNNFDRKVKLLDPGCGPGSLTASFVDEALRRKEVRVLNIDTFDIEEMIKPYISEVLSLCTEIASKQGVEIESQFNQKDFIFTHSEKPSLLSTSSNYTHVIMNPPYKKISSSSKHRMALRSAGIETVNLYTGFVALAIKNLVLGGELVAIIPRSFCNGLYYREFRELILKETSIQHIHIFDSRSNAFSQDKVLQENIIIHLVKGAKQESVTITSSPIADFHYNKEARSITATDKTTRTVPFSAIVNVKDKQKFIHIAANERDQRVISKLSCFNTSLEELTLQVSTGPVVGFRLKDDLRKDIEINAVPMVYPAHLNGSVQWPINSKKSNAIVITEKSKKWLWTNSGSFVIVKRFSAKEERRRIVATIYDGKLPYEQIGFDNKLNLFHFNKKGIDQDVGLGLYVYLNSTLLDKYYRLFGGHTQVNATDLRSFHYPNIDSLKRMGKNITPLNLKQDQIDNILEKEITRVSGNTNNPLLEQEKIDQALHIITALGMPRAQQNERSALTFLALAKLHPEGKWEEIQKPMLGVTPIMDWCRDIYGKEYAANTRETFRRQTLHQFIDGGLCQYNPDKPDRAVNSPKACYQITPELYDMLRRTYGTDRWEVTLHNWLENRETLTAQYAMKRDMKMIPLTLEDGTEIKLSPGIHSQLIHDIVVEFGPRFAPSSEVIYLGDTGAKEDFFRKEKLATLGVTVDRKGKLPDVVLYWQKKEWLLLIESVTSHGPVDGKRHGELSKLFAKSAPGLVYVTAFPDRQIMTKYLTDISWETEVWMADAPTHMIHFNGDRFLGPHMDEK
jgi:adenine-specific DNA-methyltransferase